MHLGRGAAHDRLGQGLLGDLEIRLVLQRRDSQHLAIVLEAVFGSSVFRQTATEVDRQSEQILHRPLVLAAGESAKIGRGILRQRCSPPLLHDPIRQQFPVCERERRFCFRRHVAEVESIKHLAPEGIIGAVDEIGIELVDPQIPFGFGRSVTAMTVLFQDRRDPRIRGRILRVGRRRSTGKQEYEQQQQACARGSKSECGDWPRGANLKVGKRWEHRRWVRVDVQEGARSGAVLGVGF